MSSKTLVLSVFVIWSLLCWYRYVCGIKQQCGDQPALAQQAIPFEPETILKSDTETYRADNPPQQVYTPIEDDNAQGTDNQSANSNQDISKVHVEELSDRVLIHFPYNSTRKEDDAAIDNYISKLAQQLKSGGGSVVLTGHTDNVGDSKTNDAFAMRRAKNIRDILIEKGVRRSQITCKGYGEKKPVSSNDTPQGRYQNRRVEIQVSQ